VIGDGTEGVEVGATIELSVGGALLR